MGTIKLSKKILYYLRKIIFYINIFEIKKMRTDFLRIHEEAISILESDTSMSEKEKKLVNPLRTLSHDIDEKIPQLSPLIRRYRKDATDIYPIDRSTSALEERISTLSKLCEKIDKKFSKILNSNVVYIVLSLFISLGFTKLYQAISSFFKNLPLPK